ncbi:MAG: hypothetical protein N3A65_03815 [candidate division WOR-3 bacterium]|nr:hypothetical protein [candidate division WOR-3 bacterium]
MRKIIFLLILLCFPMFAKEIWLGVVHGMSADTLILVDGLKIYVPGLSGGKFCYENGLPADLSVVTFPLKASLVIEGRADDILTETGVKPGFGHLVKVKIHSFCEFKDGRLIDKK